MPTAPLRIRDMLIMAVQAVRRHKTLLAFQALLVFVVPMALDFILATFAASGGYAFLSLLGFFIEVLSAVLACGLAYAVLQALQERPVHLSDLFWGFPRPSVWLVGAFNFAVMTAVFAALGHVFNIPIYDHPHRAVAPPARMIIALIIVMYLFTTFTSFCYASLARYDDGVGATLRTAFSVFSVRNIRYLLLPIVLTVVWIAVGLVAEIPAFVITSILFHLHVHAPNGSMTIIPTLLFSMTLAVLMLLAVPWSSAVFVIAVQFLSPAPPDQANRAPLQA